MAIKSGLGRPDFTLDPALPALGLVEAGYAELPVMAAHAAAVRALPDLHRDPFDRLLLAQAVVEGMELVTTDAALARYPAGVRAV